MATVYELVMVEYLKYRCVHEGVDIGFIEIAPIGAKVPGFTYYNERIGGHTLEIKEAVRTLLANKNKGALH